MFRRLFCCLLLVCCTFTLMACNNGSDSVSRNSTYCSECKKALNGDTIDPQEIPGIYQYTFIDKESGQTNYTIYLYDDFTWKWYSGSSKKPGYEGTWEIDGNTIHTSTTNTIFYSKDTTFYSNENIDFGDCIIVNDGVLHDNNLYRKLS